MAAAKNSLIGAPTKTCGRCHREQPLSCFSPNGARPSSRCKECARQYAREHRRSPENKAKAQALRKRPEAIARRKANDKTPERWAKILASARRRYHRPDVKAELALKRRSPEALERTRTYNRKYRRERSARDPVYKVRMRLSSEIARALRGDRRASKWWQEACGFTVAELRKHLEEQFTAGMSWDNYGKLWEIDHIRPIAAFNITSPDGDEFRAAWSLSNLRPLLKTLNRAKGASLT